jgi:hypothetical protein
MALDFGIYQLHMPVSADIRSSNPHNQAVDSSRKSATFTAIGACSALSLLARDPNIFIFGAGFAVVLDFYYRHANAVSPQSGQVTLPPASGTAPGGVSSAASS